MIPPADKLRSLLVEFAGEPEPDLDRFTRELGRAFLAFGSETDDNVSTVSRIDMGQLAGDPPESFGLRIRKTGDSLADILNHLEGEPIPEATRRAFPDLEEGDFDAAIRIAVLCLSAFERTRS